MRWLWRHKWASGIAAVALCFGVFTPASAAHQNGYAFEARDVKIRQNGLRWVFNRTFPDWGPHEVRCRGLNPTTMRGGGRGYFHIRCEIVSMNVPDFIYHLNSRGEMFARRAW